MELILSPHLFTLKDSDGTIFHEDRAIKKVFRHNMTAHMETEWSENRGK